MSFDRSNMFIYDEKWNQNTKVSKPLLQAKFPASKQLIFSGITILSNKLMF